MLTLKAHDRFVNALVYSGKEVWSAHGGANHVKLWDIKTGELRATLPLPNKQSRVHSLTLVNLRGDPVIWVGGDDEIVIFDIKKRRTIQTLSTIKEGDVLCMQQTGMDCVWAGMRHKDNTGSFTEWNLN
jgi:WD40 repeat protein